MRIFECHFNTKQHNLKAPPTRLNPIVKTFKDQAKAFLDGVKGDSKEQRLSKLYDTLLPSKSLGSVTADQVREVKEKFNLPSLEAAERVLALKNEL